jgi:hypothetical protein
VRLYMIFCWYEELGLRLWSGSQTTSISVPFCRHCFCMAVLSNAVQDIRAMETCTALSNPSFAGRHNGPTWEE